MYALYLAAEETAEAGEPALSPIVVGLIALGILLAMLMFTLAFGKGRPHT